MARDNLTLFDKLMGGGLLAGKKTYLAAASLAIVAVISWLSGDLDGMQLAERLIGAFTAASIRAGIAKGGVQCALPAMIGALFIGLALAGCATPQADTTKQRYAAVISDYEAALSIMVGYRDACAAAPDRLPGDCVAHVGQLRQLDRLAEAALLNAGAAVKSGSGDAGALISAAVGLVARIGAYIVQAQIGGVDTTEARNGSTGPPLVIMAGLIAALSGRSGGAVNAPPSEFGRAVAWA